MSRTWAETQAPKRLPGAAERLQTAVEAQRAAERFLVDLLDEYTASEPEHVCTLGL